MGKSVGLILALKDECSPQVKKLAERLSISEKEAKKLNTQIKKLGNDAKTHLKSASTHFTNLLKPLAVLGVSLGGIGVAALSTAASFEQYKVSFDTLLGSQEKSKKLMGEITKFAASTPFAMEDLVSGTQRLLAFGVSANEVVDRLGRLGDLSMGNAEKLNRLTLAYGKIKAKGKASMEELNQLTEAGVPILDELARSQHKSVGAIMKMVSSGKIGYKEVEQAVISLTSKGGKFYQMTLKQSQTLEGVMSTLKDSFNIAGGELAQDFLPQIKEVASLMIDKMPQIKSAVAPAIKAFADVVKFTVEHLGDLAIIAKTALGTFIAYNAINGAISTFRALQSTIQAVSAAQSVWNYLMNANPIGAVIISVGVLIGVVALLVKNWDKVTGAVKKAFNAMKTFVGIKPKSDANISKTNVKKNALGTSFSTGGVTLVGEHGAELVNMPQGASVTNANTTNKIFNSNSGINLSVTILGNMIGNNEFLNQLGNLFAQKLRVAMAVR